MLDLDHPFAEPAWNGLLYSKYPPSSSLAELIKPQLVKLFPWIEQFAWDDHTVERAATLLCSLRIFHSDEPYGLTSSEMRTLLRNMSEQARIRVIWGLGRVGQENENGWVELVIPFIRDTWPRERRYKTTASVRAWINLLGDAGDHFPAVYEVVKPFLASAHPDELWFYRFKREGREGEKPLASRFPEEVLDLLDLITLESLSRPSHDLPSILELIAEARPSLTSDRRYLRLVDLVERS